MADFIERSALSPFSLEAEQSVLGAILIDPGSFNLVADTLRPDHFYLPQHKAIYKIFLTMFFESKAIDSVTVLDEVKKAGLYDDAGGKAYLLQLAQIVPTSSNIEKYSDIVREKHSVRSLLRAAQDILEESSTGIAADELLNMAEQRVYEIRQGKEVEGLRHIKDVIVSETLDRLDKLSDPEKRKEFMGIPSGIAGLDRITTGFNKSDLIILGSRPGMGKTSFVLNVARHMATKEKKNIAVFSLEMTRDQLAQRLLADTASIASEKFRVGNLDDKEWVRLTAASEILSGAPIYFDQTPGITVAGIMAKVRRLKKIDCIIIDYLQLMQADIRSGRRIENRVQEVTEITKNLKILAKDLNVPVIVCAQLSRSTEARGKSHKPQLSDLRESGSIEQDADIVMFLYREDYYKQDAENMEELDPNAAELIVAKNRHGETATVHMRWDGKYTRFTSVDTFREDA